jgi:hypothetical protein
MMDYEHMQGLFQMLKVKYVFKRNWSKISSWGMVEVMHEVLLEATKATFAFAKYIDVNVDEATTTNNTQWLSIHLYVVQGWKRILIFLCVETIGVFATSDNVFGLIVKSLFKVGKTSGEIGQRGV